MRPEKKDSLNLEALLRLKRAERPQPEFWARFESELRTKQLAAIVAKRPWWHGFSRISAAVSRNHLPIGATAVLALTWIGLHQFETPGVVSPAQPIHAGRMLATAAPAPAVIGSLESRSEVADDDSEAPKIVAAPAASPVVPANSSHTVELTANREAPARFPSEAVAGDATDPMMTMSRSLNVDLASMQANGSDLSRHFMGVTPGFAATEVSARPMTDPLARLNPASDERRSRLLATALPVVATSAGMSEGANDRMVTRLSEDRFYESASRYSGEGNRFSIKF